MQEIKTYKRFMNLTDGNFSSWFLWCFEVLRTFIWEEFMTLLWRIPKKILGLPLDGSPGAAIAKMLSKEESLHYIVMI